MSKVGKVARSQSINFVTRQFPKEDLRDLLDCSTNEAMDGYVKIADHYLDQGRWSVYRELIFKYEGKYYVAPYSHGSTEQQEEYPFDDSLNGQVVCYEAEQIPVTKFKYVRVKQEQNVTSDTSTDL